MNRTKLTLRPQPAKLRPHQPTPADPVKISLSQALGFRFIDRKGRYIMQAKTVIFSDGDSASDTWVDIPLVPEVYG